MERVLNSHFSSTIIRCFHPRAFENCESAYKIILNKTGRNWFQTANGVRRRTFILSILDAHHYLAKGNADLFYFPDIMTQKYQDIIIFKIPNSNSFRLKDWKSKSQIFISLILTECNCQKGMFSSLRFRLFHCSFSGRTKINIIQIIFISRFRNYEKCVKCVAFNKDSTHFSYFVSIYLFYMGNSFY